MYALTQLRIVWTSACMRYIIGRGYPFPNVPLDTLSVQELERYVCHAARLATKWLSRDWVPARKWSINATTNTSVTDVRLIPGSAGALMLTLSKSVWSAVTIWELEPVISRTINDRCSFHRRCEWSPRGAIFSGFALNSCPSSEVKLAISVLNNGFVLKIPVLILPFVLLRRSYQQTKLVDPENKPWNYCL